MGEQPWCLAGDPPQESVGPGPPVVQPLVLASRPTCQMLVEGPEQGVHCRLVEGSVVVEPALDSVVYPLGQFVQALAGPPREPPPTDFVSEPFSPPGRESAAGPAEIPAV